jgi:hypothetical protein
VYRTNMPDAYLLDDKTWAAIEPLLPTVYADKLARNFASAVALAAVIIWWVD